MSRSQIISILLLIGAFEVVLVLGAIFVFETNPLGPLMLANAAAVVLIASKSVYTRIRRRRVQPSQNAAPAAKPESQEFERELRNRISEANESLARSGQRVGGRAVRGICDYPLYLLLGPAKAGKTSLLVHSGPEPKLLSRSQDGDAATSPTKCCNFWLANDAIFADVSSEIFLGAAAQWTAFVRMLRNHAAPRLYDRLTSDRRALVKGVILVLDAPALIEPESTREQAFSPPVVRERLHDLGSELGCEFPVYTVFSKADGLRYFTDFWERLTESEDQRVVGVTVPLPDSDGDGNGGFVVEQQRKKLSRYYSRLSNSLADKRTMMLAREPLSAKKPAIYEFPREFKRIRGATVELLLEIFRQTTLRRGPRLRGFYFTAMTRTHIAKSFDDLPELSTARVGSAATVYFSRREVNEIEEIRPASSSGGCRWVFAGELFSKIILPDPAFCGHINRRPATLTARLVSWAAPVLGLILLAAWTISWARNSAMLGGLKSAEATAASRRPAPPASVSALNELESLRTELMRLETYRTEGPPLSMRWGLYSGARAADALRRLYFLRFRTAFLDPITGTLSSELLRAQPGVPSSVDVYERLKVYRMVTSGSCRPDRQSLERTLPAVWPYSGSVSPDTLSLAGRQLRFYISELLVRDPYGHQIPEVPPAVAQGRAWLAQTQSTETALAAAIAEVNRAHTGASLREFSSNYAEVLAGPDSVDWAYTPAGWQALHTWLDAHRQVGDACVIGAAAAGQNMPASMKPASEADSAFVKQYIARWKQFLAAEQIRPYANTADAAKKLRLLSDTRSPLLALVFMVSKNTTFATASLALPQALPNKAPSRISRWLRRGSQAAAAKPGAEPAPIPKAGAADITRAYQPANAVVSGASSERWLSDANRAYVGALAELGDSLSLLAPGPATADQTVWEQAYKSRDKAWAAARQLEQSFNNTPEEIDLEMKRLLEAPIRALDTVLPANRNQQTISEVNGAARKFCSEFDALRRKYPFNPRAQAEVTVDELVRVFAPGAGAFAQLVSQAALNAMLQKQGNAWVPATGAQQPRLTPQFVQSMNTFSRFADALFPNGATKPHLEYALSLDSTSTLIPFELEIGGTKVTYAGAHSPRVQYVWPATEGGGAKLTVRSGLTLDSAAAGVWALFRLLERAENPRPGLFTINKLTFAGSDVQLRDSSGQVVTLEIHVDSANSAIFNRGYFSECACVSRAAQ